MNADGLEWRLQQWGRWCRENPRWGTCLSAEREYRSPQVWYPPGPRSEPVDERLALDVERCMRDLAKDERKVLKFWYVYRWGWDLCCRRLRLSRTGLDVLLDQARDRVDEALAGVGPGGSVSI